ncbi:GntR family transcriptional regulator [Streptomyces sp. AJS327]|uniref:GntR family transcriptional regulator n=1 Tax=Streptomyces sp. AJS327 TaxID=2545265 RepID=UPI0015DF44B5|nr:GntR family transcriptional regulator [Streptomyces sp. AJS327]MBA0051685.1 GntR family transcriptional regulator [Streptomyces sp. AJS327]
MLNREGGLPLYAQLVEDLRQGIESGQWPVGSRLPSERELCTRFDVSRITVRHAIDIAQQEGLLERVHGVGTFVAQPPVEQTLNHVNSFEQTLAQRGLVAATSIHSASATVGDLALASVLRLEAMEPVTNLQLVGRGNDEPVVFYDSYFPQDVGEQVVSAAKRAQRKGSPFSTLDLYRDSVRAAPDRLEQTFEAMVADRALADLLAVSEGWPVLRVISVMSQAGRPIEYRMASYRGDRYRFAVERDLPTHG